MSDYNEKVTSDTLSFSHPLFLHPSDAHGVSIIPHVLVGAENYVVWSQAMTTALRGKNKLGFVDGSCKRELQEESLREQWDRCDAVVLSWLLSSLSKELANGIIFLRNSYLVWMNLQQRFDKKFGSRIFSLHREIHSLKQGSTSVTTYYSKLKKLWEKQSSLIQIPSCTCATSKAYSDVVQHQQLLTFLMGLNEVHSQARSHILLLFPLPSVNDAYSMIVEDEAQRQLAHSDFLVSPNGIAMDVRGRGRGSGRGRGEKIPIVNDAAGFSHQSMMMADGRWRGILPSVNDAYRMAVEDEARRQLAYSDSRGPPNGVAMAGRGRGRGSGRGRGEKITKCTHCNKKGHLRENCHELVGHRPNFRGNRGKQVKESTQTPINSASAVEERSESAADTAQFFTKEQLQQILDMLKRDAEPTIHTFTDAGPSGWEDDSEVS